METETIYTHITGQPKIIAYSDTKILEADFTKSLLPIRWRICRLDDATNAYPFATFAPNTDISNYIVPDHHVLIVWSPLPFDVKLRFDTSVENELPYPEDNGTGANDLSVSVIDTVDTPNPPEWKDDAIPGDKWMVHHRDGELEIWTKGDPEDTYELVGAWETVPEEERGKLVVDTAVSIYRGCHEYHCEGNITLDVNLTDAELGTCFTVHVPVITGNDRVKVTLTGSDFVKQDGDNTMIFNYTGTAKFKLYDGGVELLSFHRSI